MISDLTKEEREQWEIKTFLELFNREQSDDYSILRKICQRRAPGPDYLIKNSKGSILGVEVCELLDHPSKTTGQQRHLESLLEKTLECEFHAIMGIALFYETELLPTNTNEIKTLGRKAAEITKQLMSKNQKGSFEIKGVTFNFKLEPDQNSNSIGREYCPDTDKYYTSLEVRIKDKICRSNNYIQDYPIILAIYNNTECSISSDINTLKGRISHKKIIWKKYFREIWLFNGPIDGQTYSDELISLG